MQERQLLPALSDSLAEDAQVHTAELDKLLALRLVQRQCGGNGRPLQSHSRGHFKA